MMSSMSKSLLIISILFEILFPSCSIEDNDNNLVNKDTNFDSLIINDSNSVEFFVLSDWGMEASKQQIEVAKAMGSLSDSVWPDFVITCGDNFQNSAVKDIYDTLWKTSYEDVYKYPGLKQWYATLGNHDYYVDPKVELDYDKISKKWHMPYYYYTFRYHFRNSSIRFIVLDTPGLLLIDELYSTQPEKIEQLRWLENTLLKNKEKWTIVFGHYPIYSASSHHGNTPGMIELIKPLLEKYSVDFYVCGHDHNFEHAQDGMKKPEYIVTGTGSDTRPIQPNEYTKYCIADLGFTFFSIGDTILTLKFINYIGNIDYTSSVIKK